MAIAIIGETLAAHGGVDPGEGVLDLFGPTERGIFLSQLGERADEAWEFYLANYRRYHRLAPKPFPGVPELLANLAGRGCRLALVTGKSEQSARLSLEYLSLGGLFEFVAGGSVEGVIKAGQLQCLAEATGVRPDDVAYVGDSTSDMEQAATAGVVGLGAGWSSYADEALLSAAGAAEVFGTVASLAAYMSPS